jgi:predicted O-methyltransferase YrrM
MHTTAMNGKVLQKDLYKKGVNLMAKIRSEKLKEGLKYFIKYIQKKHDTQKLSLLEIGTFNGESTEIFAPEFYSVTTVDPYDYECLDTDMKNNDLENQTIQDIENGFIENVLKKHNNIIKIKSKSLDFAKECKEKGLKFDVIYIDAKHDYEYVIEDIKAWLPLAKLYISGHDYLRNKSGVMKAVAEMFVGPDMVFQDHSWIVKRG